MINVRLARIKFDIARKGRLAGPVGKACNPTGTQFGINALSIKYG
jgi:hypothetical protein